MPIHVVMPGDNVWALSRRYGISGEAILEGNGLSNSTQLVVGQTLVIPLPTTGPKPTIETCAYIDPNVTRERSASTIDKVGEWLTYLTIFSYEVNRDGSLKAPNDEPSLSAALADQVAPILVLTNLENGQFSTELATTILTQEAVQDRMLDEAIGIMQSKGYRGLDFDFEYLGAENREAYVWLLAKAAQRLRPLGYTLSAALAPKYSATQQGLLYEGHDYDAIGQIVDFMFLMTYEWGWAGGTPEAVSPVNLMRDVLNYAVSVVPRQKIMMGIPLYGYNWTLPYEEGKFARTVSPQRAIELARRYNQSIQYDETAQAPWFRYTDEQEVMHEVWFEDARSIQAKFDLVKEMEIRGFFYWVLGLEFPQNWLLIQENFNVRKFVR